MTLSGDIWGPVTKDAPARDVEDVAQMEPYPLGPAIRIDPTLIGSVIEYDPPTPVVVEPSEPAVALSRTVTTAPASGVPPVPVTVPETCWVVGSVKLRFAAAFGARWMRSCH